MFTYPGTPPGGCSFDVLLLLTNACPLFSLYQLINPEDSHLPSLPDKLTNTSHIHTFKHAPNPLARNNLKGDIRNKFNTSANPRSALRTKRNLILDKPPDRISALALCCWFTAIPHLGPIPSYLSSATLLASFSFISIPVSAHNFFCLPPYFRNHQLHSVLSPCCIHSPCLLMPQPPTLCLLPVVLHIVWLHISVPPSCRSALIPLVLNAGTTSSAYLSRHGSM